MKMEIIRTSYTLVQFSILVFALPTDLFSITNSRRSLKTGDTFTPAEMLPVTVKLIQKVEAPGLGKGIVSASRNAEDLADRLFEAFFLTSKRFVTLKEFDIPGLDALQALALSGEVANPQVESVTEKVEIEEMYLRGQIINRSNEARKCKYKLFSKNIDINRRGIALAKKLSKKRRLIVKSRRDEKQAKNNVSTLEKAADGTRGETKDSLCRWRYECNNPADLDSCQLHTQCVVHNKTMTTADYIGVQQRDPEHLDVLRRFRKMVGLSVVDEEVEKILETRILFLKPNNLDENDKSESLVEYFNKIIMTPSLVETTTAAVTNNYVKAQSD